MRSMGEEVTRDQRPVTSEKANLAKLIDLSIADSKRARCIVPLLKTGADFYVFGEAGQDRATFRADGGGDDHAVGFDAAKFARSEIGDDGDFPADERFRLVILGDAGADLADFGADVD